MMKTFLTLLVIFVVILYTNRADAQGGDILDIAENLDLIALAQILSQFDIDQACAVINNAVRDDVCFKQLKVACGDRIFLEKMLDASSKFPYTGMLVKTRLDLGSYDECIGLDTTEKGVRVLGKHCTGGLIVPVSNDSSSLDQAYILSTCIPNECTAMELLDLANLTEMYPLFNDFSCSTKETYKVLGWDDYAVIIFLTLVVLVMIASTIYDLYLYYTNTECPNILFRAFSMFYNGQKLLKVSKGSSDEIKVIHGLRVFSMMWIVVAHSFTVMINVPGTDVDYGLNFEWTRKSTYLTTVHLAVDTFFFISGFLIAYHYLKGKPTSFLNHVKRIPVMIFHRYVRLTPVVAAAFLVVITILIHMGDGPLYPVYAKLEQDKCLNHWWSYFLYVQNYVNYDDMCILTTWYLSADWQLFLISPIVLIPVAMLVKTKFKWVMIQLLILNLIFTSLPIVLKFVLNDHDNFFETHARLNDYFIGFMLGVYMRERNVGKYRITRVTNIIIWICVLITMVVTTLIFKEIQLLVHFNEDTRYNTYLILLRALWCLSLCWVLYACHHGYGGFINWFLTTPFVQVLSKLNFCMYILHAWPVLYLRLITRLPLEYSQFMAIKDTIAAYVMTVALSVGWTFAFESPIITIEKFFLGNRS